MGREKFKLCVLAALVGACFAASAGMDRSRFNIGTYYLSKPHRSEQMIRDMKACGIDFVIQDFTNDPQAQKWLAKNKMGSVELYVVPVFWGGKTNVNGNISKLCPVAKYVEELKKHSFTRTEWMYNLGDELSALDFPHLGAAIRAMRKIRPKVPIYLNLHPSWHQDDKIRTFYGTKDYREYIEAYCREIPLDYISYDHYPYAYPNIRDWCFARYFDNFRIVADACKATGRSFWFIPQVNTFDPSVDMTEDKLRYQAFAALSFGAEVLTWACWSPGWWEKNVLYKDGTKTGQYERLKTVNAEIRRIAGPYMQFRRVETHFTGFTGPAEEWLKPEPRTFLPQLNFNETNGVSTAAFADVKADDGKALIIGDFIERKAGGKKCAMLVFAADDPFGESSAERVVRFTSKREVKAIASRGEAKLEQAGDGAYAVRLRSSDCVFVVAR